MMNWILSLLFLTNFLAPDSLATPDSKTSEVERAIISLFDAMRASDGNQIRSIITDEATLHTVTLADGEPI
ncbi:hypothetical protein BH23BAC3_BH23BAC3_24820 [soil metagenome]